MSKIYDAFGPVGKHVAPHTLVRRWDTALAFALGVFVFTYAALIWLVRLMGDPTQVPYMLHLIVGASSTLHYLTLGIFSPDNTSTEILALTNAKIATYVSFAVAMLCGGIALRIGLVPRRNMYVLDGPQLRQGADAEKLARQITKKEVGNATNTLALHPLLRLAQTTLNRHILIYGSVGSGKTEFLKRLLQQIMRMRKKLFLYDVKGDFTSFADFGASDSEPQTRWAKRFKKAVVNTVVPRPIILSPYDKRGYVWDVACDIHTSMQVEEFARSMIADNPGETNPFFTNAARMIFVGSVRTLIANKPRQWNFTDLNEQLNKTAAQMQPDILAHYAKAFSLIENAESQTTSNVMSTVMSNMQAVEYLAQAWPVVTKRRFSITEWASDSYRGRKAVIVQGGGMELLTSAYISSLINTLVGEVISPKMTENKDRGIYIVLDELTSAGRLNIMPLIDKGRSKGVTFIAAIQELGQLAKVYSQEDAKILPTIVGTHVICQLQMSETRKHVAEMFGTNVTASLAHDPQANVHQDGRQVVFEHQLTNELGPRSLKKGFEVRAIVAVAGYDPMLLAFPGFPLEVKRPGQVPAKWMTEAAAVKKVDAPLEPREEAPSGGRTHSVMTQEEIYDLFR
ncbi:DUF853 family protein [Stenotrophomonas maltophilia]|uniref:helicase HerA-like domain-containing protein n=1 Tax=Stenotrophomonas maltophilia group TaxID=995085 RepID=UPI0018D41DF8|nr:helicase HerA-like domain-containing protein [Stenotrophomonas maltophilia]MBH1559739.1 DUF853 family protein [Stenotrophomonas maltophilia]